MCLTPIFSLYVLDDAFWAQARFEGLRGLSDGFVHKFVGHCATYYPLLPRALGATGLQPFRVGALASTVVREKSPVHRFVDKYEFLKRFFAEVSPDSVAGELSFRFTCHVRFIRYLFLFFVFYIQSVVSAFVLQWRVEIQA
jgi:hypothetical protein